MPSDVVINIASTAVKKNMQVASQYPSNKLLISSTVVLKDIENLF